MKKENLPSRTWKYLQRNTASRESHDGFAAVVGVWLALRRAERSQRKMIEACERVVRIEKEIAASRTGEQSSADEARFGETYGAYADALKAQGDTHGIPVGALKRYVAAIDNDKLQDARNEVSALEKLLL